MPSAQVSPYRITSAPDTIHVTFHDWIRGLLQLIDSQPSISYRELAEDANRLLSQYGIPMLVYLERYIWEHDREFYYHAMRVGFPISSYDTVLTYPGLSNENFQLAVSVDTAYESISCTLPVLRVTEDVLRIVVDGTLLSLPLHDGIFLPFIQLLDPDSYTLLEKRTIFANGQPCAVAPGGNILYWKVPLYNYGDSTEVWWHTITDGSRKLPPFLIIAQDSTGSMWVEPDFESMDKCKSTEIQNPPKGLKEKEWIGHFELFETEGYKVIIGYPIW